MNWRLRLAYLLIGDCSDEYQCYDPYACCIHRWTIDEDEEEPPPTPESKDEKD